MPTKKMHDEESYELDNVYNEDDRFYTRGRFLNLVQLIDEKIWRFA